MCTVLQPGYTLRLVKSLGYGWSATRSSPALLDQVGAALTSARYAGWDILVMEQRAFLDRFWEAADVEIDGDPVIQQAVRFSLFQMLQAGARTEGRAIGAKGLTGVGYGGHTFWDVEGFVMEVLSFTVPEAAAHALRWRGSTLNLARARARTLGLGGAAFPWRTIDGEETSAYWPAGTAAFHINADIARAFDEYRIITGERDLERTIGAEVLIETARLWRTLGHHDRHGHWHVDGITGPDEYTAVVNDNIFTNLMAARNLRAAADACLRQPLVAERLGVTAEEVGAWHRAAGSVYLPYDNGIGVHQQCENFTRFDEWDFELSRNRHPLMLHAPYFQLYRKQVIKQADLVLAMQWCPEAFTFEQKARNLSYYERRTVRDSSLSACTQAVMCAEVGHLRLAHEYLHEAALVDLRDLQGNTSHGLHIASLAGTWIAIVEGFGGMRREGETLRLAPSLPDEMQQLTFRLRWRGLRLLVEVTTNVVRLAQLESALKADLFLRLYDENVVVTPGLPVVRSLRRPKPLLDEPVQPKGYEPRARPGSV